MWGNRETKTQNVSFSLCLNDTFFDGARVECVQYTYYAKRILWLPTTDCRLYYKYILNFFFLIIQMKASLGNGRLPFATKTENLHFTGRFFALRKLLLGQASRAIDPFSCFSFSTNSCMIKYFEDRILILIDCLLFNTN